MDVLQGIAAFAALVTIGAGGGYAVGATVLSAVRRARQQPMRLAPSSPTPAPRR